MRNNCHGGQKSRQSQAIADLLHCYASRSQGRRRHERSTEVVNHDSDDNVRYGDGTLADNQRPGVFAWVAHFRHDREEGRSTSISKDQRRAGRDCCGPAVVGHDLEVGDERLTIVGSSSRAVLNADGDGECENGEENSSQSDPCDPADFAQCLDASQAEAYDGSDCNKGRSAGAVA